MMVAVDNFSVTFITLHIMPKFASLSLAAELL
jgi:hypothetical protein